jgi:phospholipid/cholesterol/gamma-HCH transport system permease protein
MKAAERRRQYEIDIEGEKGGENALRISGRISLENLKEMMSEVEAIMEKIAPTSLVADLSGIEYLDSAGALILWQIREKAVSRSITFKFINMSEGAKGVMDLLDPEALTAEPIISERKTKSFFEEVGEATLKLINDFITIMTFLGDLVSGMIYSLLHPRSVRWDEVSFYMKRAGVDGLPIVGLIGFLLGFVIALMAFEQLRQFGGNAFVASVVAVAMVKEFGPIMTAILVAGRTGSSFAAEIGTMKVNEEVDAIVTMGFDSTRFLAIPKVLATMLVVPLLTLYSDTLGILGGMVIGTSIAHLTTSAYIEQIPKSIGVIDIVASLVKSLIFAIIISAIGCQRGFKVKGGAEGVGTSTTSAVVAAIFLVIVTDTAFAIILDYIT